MAITKKSTNNKFWRGCGEDVHCWWKCKRVQSYEKTLWKFHVKLGIHLPYDPLIPLWGMYPEKTTILKDTYIWIFTATVFTIATAWKQPRCTSTDEWMKVWYIYSWNIPSHKKEQIWVSCNEVDELQPLIEWSKSEREKQVPYINAYVWNLEKCCWWS